MSADPVVLDAAVRGWRQRMLGVCTCSFCIADIRGRYRFLLEQRATPESHVVREAFDTVEALDREYRKNGGLF